MKVKDFLKKKPLSISGESSLRDALDLIFKNGSDTVFVVDAADRILGSITVFDIFRSCLPSYFEDVGNFSYLSVDSIISSIKDKLEGSSGTRVAEVLNKDFIVLEEEAPAVEAIRLMVTKKESVVAIVKDQRLIGSVSASDIVKGLLA